MAARRNRRRRRRNRGRFGFLYKLLSALLIFAAILTGCVVFFRVNRVVVEGDSPYSQEEIVAASGVEQGDNLLFGLNEYRVSSRIYTRLPYIDTVNFSRRLPDTLVIRVTESTPAAWVESGGRCWLLDVRGKILDSGDASLTQGQAQVLGLTPVNPAVGNRLTVAPEQQSKLDRLTALLSAIEANQMTGSLTSFIDLTSDNEIRFGYGDNLTIVFPMNGDFAEKTYDLRRTLETMDERGIPRTGTLDLNYESREGHLLPERWLPSETAQPAESVPPSPSPALDDGTQGEIETDETEEAE